MRWSMRLRRAGRLKGPGSRPGDVVLRFDGKAINASSDLPRIIGAARPGSKGRCRLWRKGAPREAEVVVAELPADDKQAARAAKPKPQEQAANRLGLVVSELTPSSGGAQAHGRSVDRGYPRQCSTH